MRFEDCPGGDDRQRRGAKAVVSQRSGRKLFEIWGRDARIQVLQRHFGGQESELDGRQTAEPGFSALAATGVLSAATLGDWSSKPRRSRVQQIGRQWEKIATCCRLDDDEGGDTHNPHSDDEPHTYRPPIGE